MVIPEVVANIFFSEFASNPESNINLVRIAATRRHPQFETMSQVHRSIFHWDNIMLFLSEVETKEATFKNHLEQ
jgi:hypothetical protein